MLNSTTSLEVDKKHVHEVRRQIEANAIKIYCSLVNADTSVAGRRMAIQESVEYALSIRKEIDEKIKEKSSPVPAGDISKTLDGTTV